MKNVLILGFGALGAALVKRHGARYEFRGVKRHSLAAPPCPVFALPIADARIMDHLAWADHIVFCPAPSSPDLDTYRATYLENMSSVVGRLTERGVTPRSIVLISSTGVYPDSAEDLIDETYTPVVESERQEVIVHTERALADSGLPFVIFRCGGLYGEGREHFRERLTDGRITTAMLSRQFVHFIHLTDVCDAIDLAIGGLVNGEIYNLVDDSEIRRVDFYRFLSSRYHLPIRDDGPPPHVPHDRRIANTKVKAQLGLRLSFPRITDYIETETRPTS
jgi:nucleoside-diphosphate-sugar epimerase